MAAICTERGGGSSWKYHIPSVLHVQDIYPESMGKKLPIALNKIISQLFIPMDRSTLLKATTVLGISSL